MEEYIREQLDKYCKENGWKPINEDVKMVLVETDHIYEEKIKSCRWWDEVIRVVEIDGMTIGFEYAVSTGDNDAEELGYVFDFDKVWEMHPVVKDVVTYERGSATDVSKMGEEVIEITSEQRDSVELKMAADGRKYWIIKVYFDRLTEPHTKVIDSIQAIDREMRERFGGK